MQMQRVGYVLWYFKISQLLFVYLEHDLRDLQMRHTFPTPTERSSVLAGSLRFDQGLKRLLGAVQQAIKNEFWRRGHA